MGIFIYIHNITYSKSNLIDSIFNGKNKRMFEIKIFTDIDHKILIIQKTYEFNNNDNFLCFKYLNLFENQFFF